MKPPTDMEVTAIFRIHVGPRFTGAGLTVQLHTKQIPGIHFKVDPQEEYRESILKGITDG